MFKLVYAGRGGVLGSAAMASQRLLPVTSSFPHSTSCPSLTKLKAQARGRDAATGPWPSWRLGVREPPYSVEGTCVAFQADGGLRRAMLVSCSDTPLPPDANSSVEKPMPWVAIWVLQ